MTEKRLAIEELGFSEKVSLGNVSERTLYRWCKDLNEILEAERYEWRVKVNRKEKCLEKVYF